MKKSIILILLLSLFLVTLYACVFESVDVKVYFHYNNEDYTDYQTDGKTGYKVTAPDDPKMDNYLFAGWFTEDDQKWNFKSNKLKSDLSLYAKYTLDGLDIYYLNDFHGAIEKNSSKNELGLAYIANYLKNKREDRPDNTIIIGGGDMYQGSAMSYQDYGRWTLDLFNLMEFDCFVIGNHEFDWGIEEILKYHDGIKENGEANFPLLAANVFYKGTDTMLENTVPYVVLDKGDKKVGVIGTIGYRLESTIITYNIEDYEFGKPQDSIKKYAPKLRNLGCDVIISVSHDSGNTANSYISSLKNEEKVDLILNAHDHVIKIDSSNGIPVLEAGSDGRAIGSVLFKFDINGKIIDKKLDNISSDPLLNVKNEEIDLMINQYKNLLDEEFGKSIISPSYYINKNELSTWIGKLMAIATSSSLGFQNSGGTREGLYAYQPIDGYKIFDILPFDNVVVTLELSGANLVSFLSSYGTDTYYAGIDVGQISSQAIYKIATNDYIYYKYSTLQKYGQNVKIHDDLVLRDLMKEELELQSQYEEYFSLNNQIRTTNVNALLSFLNVNVANGFVYYS